MSEGDEFYGKTKIENGKRNRDARSSGGEIGCHMGFD